MRISRFIITLAILFLLIGLALMGGALVYGKRLPSEQVAYFVDADPYFETVYLDTLYLSDIDRGLSLIVAHDFDFPVYLWSPDGRYLLYGSYDCVVHLIDFERGRDERITNADESCNAIVGIVAWSPNSQTAIYSFYGNSSQYFAFDVISSRATPIHITTNRVSGNIAWSPDGTHIAMWGNDDKENDIHIYDIALGTHQRMFVERNFTSPQLHWFDNSTLVIASGGLNIRYIDVQTRRLREVITNNAADHEDWQWSPDGTHIAFTLDDPKGGVAIYTMDVLGRNQRRLTDAFPEIRDLTWTPDGTWIAFTTENGFYTVSVEDNPIVTLITDDYYPYNFSWRP